MLPVHLRRIGAGAALLAALVMATKLYFHDAANDLEGTFPAGEQSAQVAEATWTDANTLRKMNGNIGAAQVSTALAISRDTVNREEFIRFFSSLPLRGAQTVGGGTATLNVADSESNAAANFWIDSVNVYVWRPSTGALVGTVRDAVDLGGTEPTAINSEQVTTFTFTTSAVSAADGDVIICEIWADFTQGMSATYTLTFYYDGTTETTVENTIVSNHAAFLELAETLTFQGKTTTRLVQEAKLLLRETVTQRSPVTIAEGFSDNFNDNSRDTTKWNETSTLVVPFNLAYTVAETNQQMKVTRAFDVGYNGYGSVGFYNLYGSYVRVEVVEVGSTDQGPGNMEFIDTYLILGVSNISAAFHLFGDQLRFERTTPAVSSTITYDPVLHHHWRIRHEPSDNTFRYETSADGLTWTQRESFAVTFDIGAVRLEIVAGTSDTVATPGVAQFDNFNTTASQVFPRPVEDRLLLADLLTATKISPEAGAQVFERLIQDGILTTDAPQRDRHLHLRESLLLSDQARQEAARMVSILDRMLLSDQTRQQADRQARVQDALLLSDTQRRTVEAARAITDALLLSDRTAVTAERRREILDALLVSDVFTAQKIVAGEGAQVITRLVQDTLLLADVYRREQEMVVRASAGLADAYLLDRHLILRDRVELLGEISKEALRLRAIVDLISTMDTTAATAVRMRLIADTVPLADAVRKVQEMIVRAPISLVDSVTSTLFETIIRILTGIAIKLVDPLGRNHDIRFRDPLGRAAGDRTQAPFVRAVGWRNQP